jgi:hypothetical protein
MKHLIYCKNLYKCHNEFPLIATIKEKYKVQNKKKGLWNTLRYLNHKGNQIQPELKAQWKIKEVRQVAALRVRCKRVKRSWESWFKQSPYVLTPAAA